MMQAMEAYRRLAGDVPMLVSLWDIVLLQLPLGILNRTQSSCPETVKEVFLVWLLLKQ